MLTYYIYGHPSREGQIQKLQKRLNIPDSHIARDDREKTGFCLYVAKKAWLQSITEGETHRLLLPEDVEVADGFEWAVEQMVAAHPASIISLFPFDFQYLSKEADEFLLRKNPYVLVQILCAVGLIMPVQYIQPCFDYIKKYYNDEIADDTGIQYWANSQRIECLTTLPSVLQHIGDISIVSPDAPVRRTKYYQPIVDKTIHWDSQEVWKDYPKKKTIFDILCVKGEDGLWRLKGE